LSQFDSKGNEITNMKQYPKILIFGQPFNNYSGGGITLTNLFKGWPKDRIAVASTGHVLYKASDEVCNIYYRLGTDEHRWLFPFNLVQRHFPSGMVTFSKGTTEFKQSPYKLNFRKILIDRIFYPFLHFIGLFHSLSKIVMSENFRNWLQEYNPDILYIQVTSREDVLFSIELCDYLQIPSVIHNMDDWPSTISKNGLFKRYWRNKIDREFRTLLDRNDLYLSISDAMTSEYLMRYKKEFRAFHNPIDISNFKLKERNISRTDNKFRILYMGRIGIANRNSIFQFANAISQHKFDNYTIELDIFTYNTNTRDAKKLAKLNNVRISPSVKHDLIPSLLAKYDLLLLPLDFTKAGFRYSKYSLPTKASEYMISGVPLIVFAPAETAISKFCADKECGYCLTDQSTEKIIDAIDFLTGNPEYRNKISSRAVEMATKLFDGEKVRNEFQQLLIDTSKG
jgi:glycosyltransferase involved in cell wall biosynthesis